MLKFTNNLAAIAAGALAVITPVTSAVHEMSPVARPEGQAITASGPHLPITPSALEALADFLMAGSGAE